MQKLIPILLAALVFCTGIPAIADESVTPSESTYVPDSGTVTVPDSGTVTVPDQVVVVVTDPTPTPVPVDNSTTLKKGSEGDAVTQLQQRLTALGYYSGPITGHFGENTKSAVKAFQRANGLSADGVVGKNTRAALYGTAVATLAPGQSATAGEATKKPSRTSRPTPTPDPYEEDEIEEVETPRPVYEYDETQVYVQADGYEIPATVTVPLGASSEKFPCVVMCHGYGSNRHEAGNGYDILAPILAQNGIATIRYDYKGCGDSEEDYVNFTFPDAVEEAMLCYEYMTARDDIDNMSMGIMGWSMGGGVALTTAGQYDMFDSVLTWAGACYDGTINEEEYAIAQQQGYYEATFDWRDPLKQSAAYYEAMKELDVASSVANIVPPVLAINGTEDTTVVPATAQKIVDASTNDDSEVYLLKGADHTFNIFSGDMSTFDTLCEVTLDWFLKTL